MNLLKRLSAISLIFLVLLSPSILITYFSYNELHKQLTEQTYAERKMLAEQMAALVESRISAMASVGIISAAEIAPLAEDGKWSEAVKALETVSAEFPYIDRIFLSDLRCVTTAYYPPSPENTGKDFSFRDWCHGLQQKNWNSIYVSEIFKRAPKPQFNTVAIMVPIMGSEQVVGAVGFAVNLDLFNSLAQSFKVDRGGFLYILNQKGQIVAHPKYSPQGEIVDYSSLELVQALKKGEEGVGINYNPIEKEERLAAYSVVPEYGWGVVITDPIDTAFIERNNTLQSLYIFYTFIVFVNAILAIGVIYAFFRLQKANSQLRQLDKLKDEFVSIASHQLRTPLTAINWYTELLETDKKNPLNQEQKSFINEIAKGSKRMVDLVTSLLNVSRIELGTFAVDPKPTDIIALVKDVVDELKPLIAEKNISIQMSDDRKIPEMNVDQNLFRMIYQNLLTNAVKYTANNGTVTISHEIKNNDLLVSVADTGFGIPKEQQDKIFTKLFRADNVRDKDTNGSGLGLYIIKSIIEQSGGKIWFESPYNANLNNEQGQTQGTIFYVLFPRTGMKKKEGSRALEVKS